MISRYKKIIAILLLFIVCEANANSMITKTGYVDVPGGRMWYEIVFTQKDKNKIPLLLLHGGPGFPHYYLNEFKNLAISRPIILYDQLGCGKSITKNENKRLLTINNGVNDLEMLVNDLKLKKLDLFGHSYGAALAVKYATKNPQKINKMILASPLLDTQLWAYDAKKLILKLPVRDQIAIEKYGQNHRNTASYEMAMYDYYHQFFCRLKPWPKNLTQSMNQLNMSVYNTMWGNSEFSATGNLKNFSCLNDLKELRMPVLITGGYHDEARPETLRKFLALLPHAKLVIYKNSSHTAFLEQDKLYLRNINNFLRA